MISSRIVQILLLVSSMTPQIKGMMPQETSRLPEEISSMRPRMEKMGENLGRLLPELKRKIMASALELKFNLNYGVYKKFALDSRVRGIALNNTDNTKILMGTTDGMVRIWDVEKGVVTLKTHEAGVTSVALSADGSIALIGFDDGTARVFNILTGKPLKIFQVDSFITSVALSADGSTALIGAANGIARLYNTRTGEFKELKGHTDGIASVALSADGSIALTGSGDKTVRVWNTNTRETIRTFQVDSYVASVALSADGSLAVVAGIRGNQAVVLDVKTGSLLNTLLTDGRSVEAVALSKDGRMVLTSSIGSNAIQVWNARPLTGQKETNTPLTVLEGHSKPVSTLAFGLDYLIASGSYDNTVIIWEPIETESVPRK